MTDVGIYAALETELTTALAGISGVVAVTPTCDIEDLVYRISPDGGGGRTPAIGVVEVASKRTTIPGSSGGGFYSIANRHITTVSTWEIAVVVRNERGKSDARSTVRTILETIRDRVHYLSTTATTYRSKWTWVGEEKVKTAEDDLYAWVATYSVDCFFGN